MTHTPVVIVWQHIAVAVATTGRSALGHVHTVGYGVIQSSHMLVLPHHLRGVRCALPEGPVAPAVPVLAASF
jgi:hypothetical protein